MERKIIESRNLEMYRKYKATIAKKTKNTIPKDLFEDS